MRYKIENILIIGGLILFFLYLINDNAMFNNILNVFIRNAHILMLLYIVIIYLSDTIRYIKQKVNTFLYPKWKRMKRTILNRIKS